MRPLTHNTRTTKGPGYPSTYAQSYWSPYSPSSMSQTRVSQRLISGGCRWSCGYSYVSDRSERHGTAMWVGPTCRTVIRRHWLLSRLRIVLTLELSGPSLSNAGRP